MYGIDWQVGGQGSPAGSALQYSGVLSLLRSAGALPEPRPRIQGADVRRTPTRPATNIASGSWTRTPVLAILGLARAHGLAVGLWRLGREDQSLWPAI